MRIRYEDSSEPGWKKVGSGIRDKHPGSATLNFWARFYSYWYVLDHRHLHKTLVQQWEISLYTLRTGVAERRGRVAGWRWRAAPPGRRSGGGGRRRPGRGPGSSALPAHPPPPPAHPCTWSAPGGSPPETQKKELKPMQTSLQCFEFGLDPDSIGSVDPYPDPGGQKWPTKIDKKLRNFIVLSAGCSLLRAECFFCSLDFLSGGLGIGKLYFLI